MKPPCRYLPRLLIFIFAALLFGTDQAQAKRIPKLYTFGPAHSEIGPIQKNALEKLPPGDRAQLEALRVDTVGFHYQHFGLFWLDIWSWGGKYTVYNHINEVPVETTPAEAAALLGIKESDLKKPLSYHVPWGLIIIVGLVLLKLLPRFLAARRQRASAVPQYQQAGTPRWSPPSQPAPPNEPPHAPPAGGPPPMPPPMPPEQL